MRGSHCLTSGSSFLVLFMYTHVLYLITYIHTYMPGRDSMNAPRNAQMMITGRQRMMMMMDVDAHVQI